MNTGKPIVIFRGDDTEGLGYQQIVAILRTQLSLVNCTATFRFLGFTQEFDTIPDDKKLNIIMTSEQTKGFPPGFGYATLIVKTPSGKIRTFDNKIPVFVKANTPIPCPENDILIEFNTVPQLMKDDQFDMYSTDWELRKMVTKLAKYFGLSVTNDVEPTE